MEKCKKCDGDGWIEIMDPDHYGAVIGARTCPNCEGTGERSTFFDDLDAEPEDHPDYTNPEWDFPHA